MSNMGTQRSVNKNNTSKSTSTTQYNVSTPTEYEKDGKLETFWTNIGRAFESEKGITVRLNALPISGTIFLSLPKENNQ